MAVVGGTAGASEPWSAPATVAAPPDGVTGFDAGLTDDGLGVVAWRRGTGGSAAIEAAVRPAGAGAWSAPMPLSAAPNGSVPQVVAGGAGRVLVTWLANGVRVRAYDPTSGWGPAEDVAGTTALTTYRVAMGSSGGAAVVGVTAGNIAVAAYRRADGTWEATTGLGGPGETAGAADVAVGPGGEAWALWQRQVGGAGLLSARHAGGPGSWGASDPVVSGSVSDPRILAHAGGAIALWSGGAVAAGATRATAASAWSDMDMGSQPAAPLGHVLPTGDAAVDPLGRLMLTVEDRNLNGTPADPSDDVLTPIAVRTRSAAGAWDGVASGSLMAPIPARVAPAGNDTFLLVAASAPSTTATQRYRSDLGTETVDAQRVVTAESQDAVVAGDHDGQGLAAWTADVAGVAVLRAAGTRPVTPPAAPAPTPTPTPDPAGSPAPPVTAPRAPVKLTGLVRLPAPAACLRRRRLTVTVRHPAGVTIVAVTLQVAGGRRKVVSGKALRHAVTLTGLPRGRVRLTVSVKLADGRTVRGSRTYRGCTGRH